MQGSCSAIIFIVSKQNIEHHFQLVLIKKGIKQTTSFIHASRVIRFPKGT